MLMTEPHGKRHRVKGDGQSIQLHFEKDFVQLYAEHSILVNIVPKRL